MPRQSGCRVSGQRSASKIRKGAWTTYRNSTLVLLEPPNLYTDAVVGVATGGGGGKDAGSSCCADTPGPSVGGSGAKKVLAFVSKGPDAHQCATQKMSFF